MEDNTKSTKDKLKQIVNQFVRRFNWIYYVKNKSSDLHLPGAKIINAFYTGFQKLDEDYDIICKYDADLVFEPNYLKKLKSHFESNPKLGIAGGVCCVQKGKNWVVENLSGKDHIRGSLKAYRKDCFLEIGKLKKSIGWDTLDELLSYYYNWDTLVDESLKVKHLKLTGKNYSPGSNIMQGEATYRMRLGLILTILIGLKRALTSKSPTLFWSFIRGYLNAKNSKLEFIVNKEQGKFIRNYRWIQILKRIKFK